MERGQNCVQWQALVYSGVEPSGSVTTLLFKKCLMQLKTCVIVMM
jgi:hypothetical protein